MKKAELQAEIERLKTDCEAKDIEIERLKRTTKDLTTGSKKPVYRFGYFPYNEPIQ